MTTLTPPSTSSTLDRPGVTSTLRFDGIDLARFLAIAGMIVAHLVLPVAPDSVAAWTSGTAATLFAVLAGVSVVLSTRRQLAAGRVGAARVALLTRAVILIGVGFALAPLQQSAVVVLVYLGVALALAIPFLRVPSWVLASTAAVLALGVPPVNVAVRSTLGVAAETGSIGVGGAVSDPLVTLRGVFLTGTYPVATWMVYVLVGMIVARALVRAAETGRLRAVAGWLVALGTTVAVAALGLATALYLTVVRPALAPGIPTDGLPDGMTVDSILRGTGFGGPLGYPGLLLDSPHTGTFLDLAKGIGIALTMIGLCLLVCSLPRVNAAVRPLRAAGAAPFTAYAMHILALALTFALISGLAETGATPPWWAVGWGAAGLQIGALVALGGVLALLGRRGPLEALTSGLARLASGRVSGRRTVPASEG